MPLTSTPRVAPRDFILSARRATSGGAMFTRMLSGGKLGTATVGELAAHGYEARKVTDRIPNS
jgi:hypothetical protein